MDSRCVWGVLFWIFCKTLLKNLILRNFNRSFSNDSVLPTKNVNSLFIFVGSVLILLGCHRHGGMFLIQVWLRYTSAVCVLQVLIKTQPDFQEIKPAALVTINSDANFGKIISMLKVHKICLQISPTPNDHFYIICKEHAIWKTLQNC